MRLWVEYLLNNPSAQNDFIAWEEEIEQKLLNQMATAAENNEMDKVRNLALERKVYSALGKMIGKEHRERVAHTEYTVQKEE